MQSEGQKPVRVDRRDFIKATTLAGMAGTLPGSSGIIPHGVDVRGIR